MIRSPFLAVALVARLTVAQAGPVATESAKAEAPPETQLGPSGDEERFELPPGFVEVRNPAFPTLEVRAVPARRGRRFTAEDLAPYFATGVLAAAKTEFDRGHYDRARKLLAGEGASIPARYLRALAGARGADVSSAAAEMTLLAVDYPMLRDRCLTHAGVALEELKRWAEAGASYAQVPPDSRLYVDARLGLARALHQQKDFAGAIAALAPLASAASPSWGRDVGAESLIAVADLAREKKDSAAEREALSRLWAAHPLSPLAAQAESRLGGSAKLPPAALVTRAEALIEAHHNKQGMEVLSALLPKLKLPEPLACRAHFAFGKAQRKERQHLKAIAALEPVVEKCLDPDLRPRALYVLGSSKSISDLGGAPATYETLAHDYPAHTFADDALFYAADAYAKLGDKEKALARLKELAERYGTGDFVAESLFKAFWIERSANHIEQGLALLAQIEERFATAEESYEVERARYWRARTLEAQGNPKDAVVILEALATEHPATYYGLISRARLDKLDPAARARVQQALSFPDRQEPWPLYAGSMGEDRHFLTAIELFRLGFPEAVSSELLAVARGSQAPEAVRLLVSVLAMAGDARAAHAVARVSLRRDLSGRITAENRAIWELAYPNAFRDLIEKHCKAAKGLAPDLLQALMREESALDPKALSWAGALGLTQLMPATARSVAAQLKIRNVTPRELLEPDLNIRLGAAYLGNLSKRFNGTAQFALASYNAGSGAVDHWRKDKPQDEVDEWVEDIPIAETRGYVKRVLRSFNTYQLLYAPARPARAASPVAGQR